MSWTEMFFGLGYTIGDREMKCIRGEGVPIFCRREGGSDFFAREEDKKIAGMGQEGTDFEMKKTKRQKRGQFLFATSYLRRN